MALEPQNRAFTLGGTEAQAEFDEGLRKYMLGTYNYMALGVAFTGVMVLVMANLPNLMFTLAVGPAKWVLFIGLIGMGWLSPKIMTMKSSVAAQGYFWVYCALWGIMISPMIYAYLQAGLVMDVARAFLITATMFAGASLVGYTTKKDLSGMGRFLMLATIGLLVAMLVNVFFVQDTGFSLLISIAVVLIFAAMTAYDTQNIKNMYSEHYGQDVISRMSIFGALQLYGNFIVMFIHLLSIMNILGGDD